MSKSSKTQKIIPFPCSKISPKKTLPCFQDLGDSPRSKAISDSCKTGHWCSRCQGIWYGAASECECPICKNRNG